jgi:hypothetical protein
MCEVELSEHLISFGQSHSILFSQATHITFICPMRFDKFPLDTQRCMFQVSVLKPGNGEFSL